MKKLIALLFVSSICSVVLPKTLSMEEAVKKALKRKQSILALQYEIDNFRQQQRETQSTFLPNITLSETSYNTGQESCYKHNYALQAKQTVLNIAQKYQYNILAASISASRHKKENQEDLVQLETETIFLQSWLLQEKSESMEKLYQSSKEEFEKAKHQYNIQLLDKNEWLKANKTHAVNITTVNKYKDEIAEFEKALEFYIGEPITLLENDVTQLTWNPESYMSLHKFEEYYKKALAYRKDLKIKQDTINQESSTSDYYLSQYIPSVGLFANASKTNFRNKPSTTSKEAGLQVTWNIADGLSNYFKSSAARARKMQATLERNDLRAKVKFEVQKAYSALEQARKDLDAQNVSFKQSRNEFILEKQQFEIGLKSQVDFENTKYQYENAQFEWFTQSVTSAIKERELLFTCGYPQK